MAVLEVEGLTVVVETRRGWRAAVRDVSLTVEAGEVLAVVGESGAGKTLLALGAFDLLNPGTERLDGTTRLLGSTLADPEDAQWRRLLGTHVGFVFQDPVAALDPAYAVGLQASEALEEHTPARFAAVRRRVLEALGEARLGAEHASRHAYEMSRGQAQRAMLAAALTMTPRLFVADEPLTGLDALLAADIVDLLEGMRSAGTAILLCTHDLGTVARLADRVAVMYAGRIVEEGAVEAVFDAPRHPYTAGLLASRPGTPGFAPLPGSPPHLERYPSGCAFHPRCRFTVAACARAVPPLVAVTGGGRVRCIRADEIDLGSPAST